MNEETGSVGPIEREGGCPTLVVTQNAALEALVSLAAGSSREVVRLTPTDRATPLRLSAKWDALLVDLSPELLDHSMPLIRLARARKPGGLVVGLGALYRDRESPFCATPGLTDVVLTDAENVVSLLEAHLDDPSHSGSRALALRLLHRTLPAQLHALARAALHLHAHQASLGGLARSLEISRWQVHRETRAAVGLDAGEFLAWCHVLVATCLLELSHWTIERISRDVGYADPRAFRSLTSRHLHRLPSELRARGSAAAVARRLADRLADGTASRPPRRACREGQDAMEMV